MRHDFTHNPCRRGIFDIFALDRAETDLRAVRAAVQGARDRLQYGRIVARDGSELELTEADLNAAEKVLLDPVERLKAEQLVHQAHRFSEDAELRALVGRLAEDAVDPLPGLVAEIEPAALLAAARGLLPPLAPPPLADDLPWPPPPEPLELHREPLERAILRDR